MPQFLVVPRRVRAPLVTQQATMHAYDEHFLVVGTVEYADATAFGQIEGGTPKKVVLQFTRAGSLETEHLATLRVHPRHHVPDDAILSGGIHRLENQEQCVTI